MDAAEKSLATRIFVAVTYLLMVAVNSLATILPINGITTGEVSDALPNLFAPTGLTFSIWGLIYILLAAYTLYQFGLFQSDRGVARAGLFDKIGLLFALSSLVNAAWIFAWHYTLFGLSLLLMIALLILLILINLDLSGREFNTREKFFIRLPFSVYFGWITVATIANVTSFLVSVGWGGFGISEQAWTVVVILVGLAISIATIMRLKDVAYGLVIIWAYLGIWIKHTSVEGFAGQFGAVITTVLIAMGLLVFALGYLISKGTKKPA